MELVVLPAGIVVVLWLAYGMAFRDVHGRWPSGREWWPN